MDFFATRDFYHAGRSVSQGDDLAPVFGTRTIQHFLVAGWATAVPSGA